MSIGPVCGQGGQWEAQPDGSSAYVFSSRAMQFAGGRITKRAGVIVERSVTVMGIPFDYPWGEAQDRSTLIEIKCGWCQQVIARDVDLENAEQLAENNEAVYQGGEDGPDEWECAKCRDERYREGMSQAEAHEIEMQLNAIMDETRDAQDAMLDRADQMRKSRKENGHP